MFERVEAPEGMKEFLDKWKNEPREPSMKDRARHWSDVLGTDKDFFFETLKMSEGERQSVFRSKPDIADKYHDLWESLRNSGWRRTQDRDGTWNWSCIYPHLIRKKTDRVFTASEQDQERWESEFYGNEFVREEP